MYALLPFSLSQSHVAGLIQDRDFVESILHMHALVYREQARTQLQIQLFNRVE